MYPHAQALITLAVDLAAFLAVPHAALPAVPLLHAYCAPAGILGMHEQKQLLAKRKVQMVFESCRDVMLDV